MKVKEESEKFQKPLFTPFLRKVEEESEKFDLKLNIQKTKTVVSLPIISWHRWGNNGSSERLYFGGAPKLLQMVTVAMKLKDACSLEENVWPT